MAMFASPSQVPAGVNLTQLTSRLIGGVRSRSNRSQVSQADQSESIYSSANGKHIAKEPSPQPSCLAVLNKVQLDPITLAVTFKPSQDHKLPQHWRESHKSEESFQQNLYESDSKTEKYVAEVGRAVFNNQGSHFTRLLSSPFFKDASTYQQRRGFKTKRSGATGVSGGTKQGIGRIEPLKVPANRLTDADSHGQFIWMESDKKDKHIGVNRIRQMHGGHLSEAESQQLDLAFAEGFNAMDMKSRIGGVMNTGGDWRKLMAFAEGYRCHSIVNQRNSSNKGQNSLIKNLIFIAVGLVVYLAYTGVIKNISVSKVQLFNGEQFEVNPEKVTVTFDDVKGCDEAKEELANVVDFLKNPGKYTALGAKLPNGCLLVGPPGVGKTLLAKAVAGEAGVPFFQASGAEFDEVFVGTGAKRVRQLFQVAKAKAPCVIFIDEIDSVGGKRTSSEMHPYANQTVNQLLTEMDGFEANEGVIVLGATNARNNLDKALLRPGRFDVEVPIRVPDLKGRQEILDLYLQKLKLDENVDVHIIAKTTIGSTGADLYNICNHAAMKAATDGDDLVNTSHFMFAVDKVTMGPQKRRLVDPKVNECTAFHEAGHALVVYFSQDISKKLQKITILPRGHSLGMTQFTPEESREFQYTKRQMLDDIDVAMGGRIAEELKYGEEGVSSGASSDMNSATRIAEDMVMRFGFSDKVGLRMINPTADRPVSDKVQEQIDTEVNKILQESYERTKKLLSNKSKELRLLAEALLEYEELTFEEAQAIIEGRKLEKPPAFDMKSGKAPKTTNTKSSITSGNPKSNVKPFGL